MSSLLDLIDSIQGDAIVPPRDVVRRDPDESDPVVAADKGTATFSDIASGVTIEYGFWLGEAFASGGSGGPWRTILQKLPRNPQTDRQPGRGPLRFKGPEVSQEVINLSASSHTVSAFSYVSWTGHPTLRGRSDNPARPPSASHSWCALSDRRMMP